ncbi:hypothetical protein [Aestuariibacter salexigens]|uniref:hypothetical protein n=1 Tax=Aestuariibacter salexigens TaxID=226010 RepID=UPI00041EDDB0|nr:hypothetical protein [Aestuariibacter salexigens]
MTKLSIVIHTEEEFDWDGGFYRKNNQVTHGKELTEFCEELISVGAKIVFAMDYAFVTSEQGQEVIRHFQTHHSDSVEFATHLHPWVNPPFQDEEPVPEKYSYPGNLPYELEYAKLKVLTEKIEEIVGYRPTTYLAGRYGVGDNSYKILNELGYKVDVSISPFADFRHQHGPDFSGYTNEIVNQQSIQRIPHSCGYISRFRPLSLRLNRSTELMNTLNSNILGKIILKIFGVKRVRLSAEGYSLKENMELLKVLKLEPVEHLIFSFHSPSSKPGSTPYVMNNRSWNSFNSTTVKILEACSSSGIDIRLISNKQS